MYQGFATDIILQQIYDSVLYTNIGLPDLVNELIYDASNFVASYFNSWIAPAYHFEENTQIVDEIYLATWAQGIFEFDSTHYV